MMFNLYSTIILLLCAFNKRLDKTELNENSFTIITVEQKQKKSLVYWTSSLAGHQQPMGRI
ncbi:hypothetical protein BLOT_014670 [Blomia tropicalis]|nr:hypothetical protein BLOT_014670 [Blomia tropicalis]